MRPMAMGLDSVFKLSIYGLTAFAGVVLGAAERGWIPFVSLPVTIFAYYWCERRTIPAGADSRGLSENAARALAFLALGEAVFEFFGSNPEGKLLAGIHMVVFLTWVVLLQQKTNYRYWLLMALGVLQIAVGSVLTYGTWFGMCMILYLFGAVWTLSVFTLYRAEQGIQSAAKDDRRRGPADQVTHSQAFNAVRLEDGSAWISSRLFLGVVFTAASGLVIASLFFVMIPRVWVGSEFGIPDDVLPSPLRRQTGLATEVRLGEMRQILESNDPVLRLRLSDDQTNRVIDPQTYAEWLGQDAPCFRGAVLTEYQNGQWRPDRASISKFTQNWMPKRDDESVPRNVPFIRQEIRLERLGNEVLLCMGRAIAMQDFEGYRCAMNQRTCDIAVRRDWFKVVPGSVEYTAFSELPPAEARLEPGYVTPNQSFVVYKMTNHLQRCSELPSDLTQVARIAQEIVDKEAAQRGTTLTDREKAKALERYLRDSGVFAYSLNAPTVDPRMDPIEDFLVNRRAGHCEYFASALALMLRSVGVPSRMVSGFKGGEPRSDNYFYVEKRFAHVWVEAWTPDHKWLSLDPTPEAGREESVEAIGTKRSMWSAMTYQLTGIWESNILDISYERQQNMLYKPVQEWFSSIKENIETAWYAPGESIISFAMFIINPRNWLTSSGAMTLGVLFAVLWALRTRMTWFHDLWKNRLLLRQDTNQSRVEFYERFVKLMQVHGHRRHPTQTQSEFVQEMADEMSWRLQDQALAIDLLPIGELFYRVRFGRGELSPAQEQELNRILTRLEAAAPHSNGQDRTTCNPASNVSDG